MLRSMHCTLECEGGGGSIAGSHDQQPSLYGTASVNTLLNGFNFIMSAPFLSLHCDLEYLEASHLKIQNVANSVDFVPRLQRGT